MHNARLVDFLENNKWLANVQCGFRGNHSKLDHLVRLDTYIRKGLAAGNYTIGVFFDLEKAYDTKWRRRILQDLKKLGMKGRMPKYISEFMKERSLQVTIDWVKSEKQEQKMGVPQGSILRVTLFTIKINALAAMIHQDIHKSLFVNDLQIAYSDSNNKQETESSNSRHYKVGYSKWVQVLYKQHCVHVFLYRTGTSLKI